MGRFPTGTVETVSVAVSITETVLSLEFATYTRDPSGVAATPKGSTPTAAVVTTVFVAVSIIYRSLLQVSVMYANGAALAPAAPASTTTPTRHSVSFNPLIDAPPTSSHIVCGDPLT